MRRFAGLLHPGSALIVALGTVVSCGGSAGDSSPSPSTTPATALTLDNV
jgi:hypothetical protein